MKKKLALLSVAIILLPKLAWAHCPLCTAGAGLAAVGAKYLGVGTAPIGVFVGGFGIAMGLWFSILLKPRFKYQNEILGVASFLLTIIPLMPLMQGYWSVYLQIAGGYGSLLNRTYLINSFIFGSIIGAIIMFASPYISRKVSKLRDNKLIPFQSMIITFGLMLLSSIIIEIL